MNSNVKKAIKTFLKSLRDTFSTKAFNTGARI